MKRGLRLALLFVLLTVPLTWLWVKGLQDAYTSFFEAVAQPLLGPLGVDQVADSPARKRFVSYVPFLVLVLLTPGLSRRRRLVGLGVGLPLIFLGHVGLVVVEHLATGSGRPGEDAFSVVFPAAVLADAFPFILWAVLASPVLRGLFAGSHDP